MLKILFVSFALLATPAPASLPLKRILRLLVTSAGANGSDYAVYVSVLAKDAWHIGKKARQLYCFQKSRQHKNKWRFFAPCGSIVPLFENTYQVRDFPKELGKIEEVLSGRTLRFHKAVVLAASDMKPIVGLGKRMPTALQIVQSHVDSKGVFIGMPVLRHGGL